MGEFKFMAIYQNEYVFILLIAFMRVSHH